MLKKMLVGVAISGLLIAVHSPAAQAGDGRYQPNYGRYIQKEVKDAVNCAASPNLPGCIKANVKIYGRLGWEAGRLSSQKKYGIDPGDYPGFSEAVGKPIYQKTLRGARRLRRALKNRATRTYRRGRRLWKRR
jgi:hypothetical protein